MAEGSWHEGLSAAARCLSLPGRCLAHLLMLLLPSAPQALPLSSRSPVTAATLMGQHTADGVTDADVFPPEQLKLNTNRRHTNHTNLDNNF